MWKAISSIAPGRPTAQGWLARRGKAWQFAAASIATAAVLLLAFQLGHLRYGAQRKQSRAGEVSDYESGWGIPVHPKAYGDSADAIVGGDVLGRSPAFQGSTESNTPRASRRRARGGRKRADRVASLGYVASSRDEYYSPTSELTVSSEASGSATDSPPDHRYGTIRLDSDNDGTPDTSVQASYDLEHVDPNEVVESITAHQVRASGRPSPPPPAAQANARIIKAGDLTLEVDSYSSAVERAESTAKEHSAFVADVSTREQPGGALAGILAIRVPPERFEALFAVLKTIGRVEAENVKTADVTADYVDLEARIASLEITEKRLAELISNKSFVDKMSALLEVEREMTRVRSQIEQLTGQLRVMADRVALSTITLNLHEPDRVVPSASLSVEVTVLDEAADALGAALAESDGRLISGKTSKRNDGTLMGNYRLGISLGQFARLLTVIESLGRVEQRQVNDHRFTDATAAWADRVKCNVVLVLFEQSRQLPTGSMGIEVNQLAPALEQLGSIVEQRDGSVVSNHTIRQDDGSSVAQLELRVPAGQFAALVDSITRLGRITDKTLSGEAGRIVGGAANALCDLSLTLGEQPREVPTGQIILEVAEFEPARQQLSALVADKGVRVLASSSNQRTDGSWAGTFRLGIKSSEIEAVVSRLESLGRVASRQINGTGLGDLSRIDPNTVGVVTLTLGEKSAINPAPERAGDSIRNRLRDGLAGLYTSLGLIVYGLIVMAPWVIIVAGLAWAVTRTWRKRQAAGHNPSTS